MWATTQERISKALSQAESDDSCYAPITATDKRLLRRAYNEGSVVCPASGVYARQEYWETLSRESKELHKLRALSSVHPDWVFAGPSAALAHGLEVANRHLDHPCTATTRKSHAKSFKGFTHIIVTGDSPVKRNGVLVTSFVRTVYDCLRTFDFPSALAIADSVLRTKGISPERLVLNIHEACSKKPGLKRVESIIELADGRAENGGESKVRAQILKLGFALPELQTETSDPLNPSKSYRADFFWTLESGAIVIGELDGKDKYIDPKMADGKPTIDRLLAERRREARLTLNEKPVRIMRFSFEEACDSEYFSDLLTAYGIPRTGDIPPVALT